MARFFSPGSAAEGAMMPTYPAARSASARSRHCSMSFGRSPVRKAASVPPDAAFLTGDLPKDIEQCRDLADALRAAGYVGIIAPSAADPGEKNLAIYIDGPASGIYLEDGGERILID